MAWPPEVSRTVRVARHAGEGVAFYVESTYEPELERALALIDAAGLRWIYRFADASVGDFVASDDTLVVAVFWGGEGVHPLGCTEPDALCIAALDVATGTPRWARSVAVFDPDAHLAVGTNGTVALLFDDSRWVTWQLPQPFPDLADSEGVDDSGSLPDDIGHGIALHAETGELFILTEDRTPEYTWAVNLRRLAPAGEQRLVQTFSGCGTQECGPLSLRLDAAGGAYVGGDAIFTRAPELGGGKALRGGFVVKLDLDGQHRWTRSFSYRKPSHGWSSYGVDDAGYVAFEHVSRRDELGGQTEWRSDLVCLGPDGTTHDTWADLDVDTMALDVSAQGDIVLAAATDAGVDLGTGTTAPGPIVAASVRMAGR